MLPKPKRSTHDESCFEPSFCASVIAPTFEDCATMSATVIRTVGRGSCSWITRSATWIDVGSVNAECGVTSPSESAPATGISLNVEPGS